jgi:membrane-associated protease RseP (regulator of RpoE activity)
MEILKSILFWDVLFLVLFTLGVILFLYKRKKKVVREGIMYLYKTKVGLRVIDKISKKYPKTLKFMSYFVVSVGYILMIGMLYLLGQFVYIFSKPQFVKLIKIPPLTPLIPYLPRIFRIPWLPPFYFTYWILAIAIIAIVHEGFHGIYARHHKIKIKSTGFGFLGPFLAFFVEQDDKDMQKKKIFPQLTVLGAGVFANILIGIIFYILMALFFFAFFVPSGALFNGYVYSMAPSLVLNNAVIGDDVIQLYGENLTQVMINNKSYFISSEILEPDSKIDIFIPVYHDQPAIRSGILGNQPITKAAVTHINDKPIQNHQGLRNELDNYQPGDWINISIKTNGDLSVYEIELGENYDQEARPMIGVGFGEFSGARSILYNLVEMNYFKEASTYFQPKNDSQIIKFFFDLLWWLVLINISVALVNMLPVAIFDGGRFFYLSVLAITKKEKIAKYAFKFITMFILFILLVLMLLWAFGIR